MTQQPEEDANTPAEKNDLDPKIDPNEEVVEAEVVGATETASPVEDEIDLPDDPAEAVPLLINELMAARARADEMSDNWQRSVAELDNYRKRSARDAEDLIARSSERVVMQLLPVLDSLDAAMALEAESETEKKMLSGMAGTRELLLTTLAREGVEPIEAIGAEFDPSLHEAVKLEEGSGTMVVESEYRRGYTLKGKVLRASLVSVGYVGGAGAP